MYDKHWTLFFIFNPDWKQKVNYFILIILEVSENIFVSLNLHSIRSVNMETFPYTHKKILKLKLRHFYLISSVILIQCFIQSSRFHTSTTNTRPSGDNCLRLHCVKNIQIRKYFGSVFSCIWTEYGDLLCESLYSVRMEENTDQK